MALSEKRTTQSKATLAQETLDEEKLKKQTKAAKGRKKKQNVSSKGLGGDVAGSAAAGAATGAVAGPVGALVGGVVGAGVGLASANQSEDDPNRPERRKLTRLRGIQKDQQSRSNQAIATLSQAVFDWASTIR